MWFVPKSLSWWEVDQKLNSVVNDFQSHVLFVIPVHLAICTSGAGLLGLKPFAPRPLFNKDYNLVNSNIPIVENKGSTSSADLLL